MKNVYVISGKIASGKSTVSKILRKNGEIVIDTDSLAKLLNDTPELRAFIISYFGYNVFADEWDIQEIKYKIINDDNLFNMIDDILLEKLARLIDDTIHNMFCVTDKDRIFIECPYPWKFYWQRFSYNNERYSPVYTSIINVEKDESVRKESFINRWVNQKFDAGDTCYEYRFVRASADTAQEVKAKLTEMAEEYYAKMNNRQAKYDNPGYKERFDKVITNNGSLEDLEKAVKEQLLKE